MWTPAVVLIAVTTLAAGVALGGAVYEAVVVDPAWPKRPGIVQARNGGISRARFWLPVPIVLEVLLVVTLAVAWGDAEVRAALLVALAAHAVARIWSLLDLTPTAAAFERANPADVDEAAARRWTRRSLLRLALDGLTCLALLAALALT